MTSTATKLLVGAAVLVAIGSAVIAAGVLDGLLPEPRGSGALSVPAGTMKSTTETLPATTQLEGLDALVSRAGQPTTQYVGVGTFADLWHSAARH